MAGYITGRRRINGLQLTGAYTYGNGGGILNQEGATLTITAIEITDDRADQGGGIENDGSMVINDSTISGNLSNSSFGGGGIFNQGTLSIVDTTIANNTARYGGGIYNTGPLTITDCTIVGNAMEGGSAAGIMNGYGAPITIQGTIVADNPHNDLANWYGSSITGTYNLIGDGSGGLSTDPSAHNILGTTANPIDPLLSPLGDYGGPTQTMELLPGSPALKAGADFDGPDGTITTDQRGVPRGPTSDIGAYQDWALQLSYISGDDSFKLKANLKTNGYYVDIFANGSINPVASYPLDGLDEVIIAGPATGADSLELDLPQNPVYLVTDTPGACAGLALTVDSGAVVFNASTYLASLNLQPGSTGFIVPGGQNTLVLGALTIGGSADAWSAGLDLFDNDLIVRSGNLANILNQLKSGYDHGTWIGQGIFSDTLASATDGLNGFAALLGSQIEGSRYDGITFGSNDVLVAFANAGDTNLDGKIDTTDYGNLFSGTDWVDFNDDGTVNGDDWALFDLAAANYQSLINAEPQSLFATDNGDTEIDLRWSAPVTSGSYTYNIYRSFYSGVLPANTDTDTLVVSGLATTSYPDTTLAPGYAYYYIVTAVPTSGVESQASNEATATTTGTSTDYPAASVVFPIQNEDGSVDLYWTTGFDGTVHYNIYRSAIQGFTPDNSTLVAGNVRAEQFHDVPPTWTDTWYYQLAAVDNSGNITFPSTQFSVWTGGYDAGELPQVSPPTQQDYVAEAFRDAGIVPGKANNDWDPKRGFDSVNKADLGKIYEFYRNVYINNPDLSWFGLAWLAGEVVGYSLNNATYNSALKDLKYVTLNFKLPLHVQQDTLGIADSIFRSMGFQYEVYSHEGIAGIQRFYNMHIFDPKNGGNLLQGWQDVDNAIKGQGDVEQEVQEGASFMAGYEQLVTASPGFSQLHNIWGLPTSIVSDFAISPIPWYGHGPNSGTDITLDNPRWNWVQTKMLPDWITMQGDPTAMDLFIINAPSDFWQAVNDRDSYGGF